MTRSITTSIPLLLSVDEQQAYRIRQKMVLRERRIIEVSNVFVSHWGITLRKGFLLPHSAENLKGTYDTTFYWKHWRLGIEQFLVSKYGSSLPKVELKDGDYFSIHTPWFGYFSWITTCLPRLIKIHSRFPKARLIFPVEWRSISFVRESLAFFPELKCFFLEEETHAFVENFIHAQTRDWTSFFYPEDLKMTRRLLLQNKYNNEGQWDTSRLYISRGKANRRKILNEDELIQLLSGNGFKVIYWEDYSFAEQVALAGQASILVGLHGAGLTNLHFMKKGSTVIELNLKVDAELLRVPFWRMSNLLGLDYYVQHCERIGEKADPYEDDVVVCMSTFKSILDSVLRRKADNLIV